MNNIYTQLLHLCSCGKITAMEDKITIIEGPTPHFDHAPDAWAMGLFEGPLQYDLAFTRLRTFNGPALVERCYRAWKAQQPIYLEYRDEIGLTQNSPIVAARTVTAEEGQVLLLWLRMDHQDEPEISPNDPDTSDGGFSS